MEKVTLKEVRLDLRSVTGSMFFCIKSVYAAFTNKDGNLEFTSSLKKIMPAKKAALEEAQAIMDWGRVGQERIIKRTDKKTGCVTEIHTTIKASCDMVLRYYVAKYNGTLTK